MSRLINRLVSQTTAPIGEMSTRLIQKGGAHFRGHELPVCLAIFLTIAFFCLRPIVGWNRDGGPRGPVDFILASQ